MSVGSIPSTVSEPHPLDKFGKQVVDTVVAPFTRAKEGADAFAESIKPKKYVHKKFDNEAEPISKLAYRVIEFYINWHVNVARNSIGYAKKCELVVEKIAKWPLTPLTYTQTGTAVQKFICETVIGSIVAATVFCTLQIFHIIPYVLSFVVLAGTYALYQTAPVALISIIAASILLLNVYFVYYVAGEVRVVTKTVTDEFDTAKVKVKEIEKKVNNAEDLVKNNIVPKVNLFAYSVVGCLAVSTALNAVACYVLLTSAL